jgi:hypothetical protein
MKNKLAIIKNGVVNTVIIGTTEFGDTLTETTVDVTSIECGIGWAYDGINFASPVKTTEELETEARGWRDQELQSTDFIVPLTDHPYHAATLIYRQELRDWPSTEDFPNTKPTKP